MEPTYIYVYSGYQATFFKEGNKVVISNRGRFVDSVHQFNVLSQKEFDAWAKGYFQSEQFKKVTT